ncbi:glycogen debranching protein GlgX [Paucibacter sp. R3-3]|uniref:Glycogen debranching protein GlgX n=1 Tax=Roseateles agri TaxID=3098619 RepID=A0ABU5DQP6_9BURK|nr:glycogen debranching protein GlgX [Paucibacter sp. R3-3]MDY0748645.1 glycogen debranching protein GlgX [Paucibacter sp. R3-3]
MNSAKLEEGRAWPMGAHWDGHGVNFAVFSAHAYSVDLCLFDAVDGRELSRTPLPGRSRDVWHGYLPEAGPGLVYGLRAQGPWRPERGHRYNPNKLLLDPYAREIVGEFQWRDEHFGADLNFPAHMDPSDNARWALKARVIAEGSDDPFDWEGDRPLHRPLAETVIYEMHVKGFTKLHPEVPEALRGSYAGLAHEVSIAHLKRLGITAVQLLPVQYRIDEYRLDQMGLSNYWGYNTIGFFSPDPRLAAGLEPLRDEFRNMVKALHRAGIEVILDVVFNHSAEGDELGPTLSFRGLDNAAYYRLLPEAKALYENPTGCGNAFDLREPRVLQMVLDSLRYWAGEMHVDGFRFDLAPVLGRDDAGFDARAAFFTALAQDPLLSPLKMIAEPWDVGPGGYQLGNFPPGWLEWNDRFRDTMRAFWIEGTRTVGEFAQRLCASSEVYQAKGRAPAESVNYVVSHDGFTLHDLVSYAERHNEANGENNRDGHGTNHSANFGVEGPSNDPTITARRDRVKRALLASALLSQGTPMLAAGDEFGHSSRGNNNPYCQDNETNWLDWSRADESLIAYVGRLLSLRREALPFANRWYDGVPDRLGLPDLAWLRADGRAMEISDWGRAGNPALGCLIGKPGRAKTPLLLLFNGSGSETTFQLPGNINGSWQIAAASFDARETGRWREGDGEVALPPGAFAALTTLATAGHAIDS